MENITLRIKNTRFVRAAVQIVFFLFLPALFVSTFSGLKAIYTAILNGTFSFTELFPQLIEVIAIIPLTIFVGRFFCGWMCAFGSLQDFIFFVSKKTFKRRIKIDPILERGLKLIKYAVLIFIAAAIWTFNFKIFSSANPWDAFAMIFTIGKLPDFAYIFKNILPAFIILLSILVGAFFIHRFFCRYLCPLGAVFSIISKLRITSISKPRKKCGGCTYCSFTCPMGVDLKNKDNSKSGECIECFECVSSCPKKNASFKVNGSDIRPAVAGAVAVAAISGIYFAGNFTSDMVLPISQSVSESQQNSGDNNFNNGNNDNENENLGKDFSGGDNGSNNTSSQNKTSSENNAQQANSYKDGTYEGLGTGFHGGTTNVKVTVSGGKISDVTLVSSEDTQRYIEYAFPKISEEIKSSQSCNVSAVSGATYSSAGIMEAVENALSKAK